MALNGADVLILVNTGTLGTPVWTVVGSQRDLSLSEGVASIDASSKASPNEVVQGGRYSAKISFGALYVPGDAAYTRLRSDFRARTLVQVRVRESGTDIEKADALITKLDKNAPDQGETTVSIDLTVSGGWTVL